MGCDYFPFLALARVSRVLLWALQPTILTYWNEFSGGRRTTRLQRRSRRYLTAVFDYLNGREQKRLRLTILESAQWKYSRQESKILNRYEEKNFMVMANIGMGCWITVLGGIQNMTGQGPEQPDLSWHCLVLWSGPDDLQKPLPS